jgi:hypothetical protein
MRTEQAYVQWIRRYIFFHHKRHPQEMGEQEIREFISDLAVTAKDLRSKIGNVGTHPLPRTVLTSLPL